MVANMPQRKASAASFFPSLSRQEEGDAMRARAGPTIGSGGWKLPRQLQHVQPSSRPLRPGVSALGSTSIHTECGLPLGEKRKLQCW
jgi:hypothetical protein